MGSQKEHIAMAITKLGTTKNNESISCSKFHGQLHGCVVNVPKDKRCSPADVKLRHRAPFRLTLSTSCVDPELTPQARDSHMFVSISNITLFDRLTGNQAFQMRWEAQ